MLDDIKKRRLNECRSAFQVFQADLKKLRITAAPTRV